MNKKAFTLIELLVVVLIIAILAAIALPKYQVARDRAHLSGLMTIGKNTNDALDRRSLFDDSAVNSAADLIDISFRNDQGVECTGNSCTLTLSGINYNIHPRLNVSSTVGANYTTFYPQVDDTFSGRFDVNTETYNSTYTYVLYCYQVGANKDPDEDRCERLGLSMGATCSGASGARVCQWK